MKTEDDKAVVVRCPNCNGPATLVQVGTASGRGHYKCSDQDECKTVWREKNPAAVALGRLGGIARAAALTPERREEIATAAGNASHRKRLALRPR